MARWRRWATRRTAIVLGAVVLGLTLLGSVVIATGAREGDGASSSIGSTEPAFDRAGARPSGADEVATGSGDAAAAAPEAALAPAPGVPAQGVPVGSVVRSLVRTARLSIEVDDPVAGVQAVRAAAAAAGGTITQEQSGPAGAWVVIRVPADVLDRSVDDVARIGRVLDRSVSVVDATEEVVDLDARVASQQASVARVRALLAEATSIGDVVAIESELARREAELDSLTGRLAALRDQVALSTLTVEVRTPDGGPVDDEPSPAGFLDGLAAGWDGLVALGNGTGAALGFVLPFLPVLAVLVGIGWLVRRARRAPSPAGGGTA